MTKTSALLVNHHPYPHFRRRGRSLLPLDDVDFHLVTRNRAFGGTDGVDADALASVTVCAARDEEQWRTACSWALRARPIERIVAVHERSVLLAAELRSRFGLPGMDVDTALRFRDKVRMKEAVRAAGAARVPDFAALDGPGDLDAVDWRTGPKVIKIRDGLAAQGVHIVPTRQDAERLCATLDLGGGRYEIEEFVHGPIYHCDSVVQDGRIRFAGVGRYLADPASYASGGTFGTVMVLDGSLRERIRALNTRVLAALGLRDGTTHLELFHTPDDELVFCEVAGRPPGGIIPPVIEWQYGFNIVEASVRLQCGLDPGPGAGDGDPGRGVCGFIAFYPHDRGARAVDPRRFTEWGIVEHLGSHPDIGGSGDTVRHSVDFRDSYVLRAPDETTLLRRVDDIRTEYLG
ncbi:hypothetical protein [Streptomyces sp. NPDC046727]|uniref:ATP-grasp domain-containing protein n=1 Tax=Streptomyces sp. NPDC046727 TaxID=3155373 RepID=UPI0033F0DA57